MLAPDGGTASFAAITYATVIAALGVFGFAAGLAGFMFSRLTRTWRVLSLVAAALLLGVVAATSRRVRG